MKNCHEDFELHLCGFMINPEFPHIGASPDGGVSCGCCGTGFPEVQCPYCSRDLLLSDLVTEGKWCCLCEKHGRLSLKDDHQYTYQVQTQLHVGGVDYVDFVVWTKEDVHIKRISSNEQLWAEILEKSRFLIKSILPELIGKYFSRQTSMLPSSTHISTYLQELCYCGLPEEVDDMIVCDNEKCQIVWFHLGCLEMEMADVPDGSWYCPECRWHHHNLNFMADYSHIYTLIGADTLVCMHIFHCFLLPFNWLQLFIGYAKLQVCKIKYIHAKEVD